MDAKEAHMTVQGRWLHELGELASLSRTTEQRLKSFITLQEDYFVPKYSNLAVSLPRRCVFVGTVNPEGAYLKGQTGNTRFLPIPCTKTWQEPPEAERLQLFAEAKQVYQHLEVPWWTVPDTVRPLWEEARDQRRETSVYEEALSKWLTQRLPGLLTWDLIAENFLLLDNKERWKDEGLQMEIAKALHALGYQRGKLTRTRDGARVYPWEKVSPPF